MSDHAPAPVAPHPDVHSYASGASHGAGPEHAEETMGAYTFVFAALMVLLVVTVVAYRIDLGRANLTIALVIAVIKAAMVLMVFMHVRLSPRLVWVFATAAFLWLGLMIFGTMNDYASRRLDSADSHTILTPEAASVPCAQQGG